MSETKHTPGPWDFEPVKVMMGYSQGIGFINLSVKQMTIEQAWNDKKLMDAAPELLAGLKEIVSFINYAYGNNRLPYEVLEIAKICSQTIVKADPDFL